MFFSKDALCNDLKTETRQIQNIGEVFKENRVLDASSLTKWEIGSKYNIAFGHRTPPIGEVVITSILFECVWAEKANCLHFAPDIKGMSPFFVDPRWLV